MKPKKKKKGEKKQKYNIQINLNKKNSDFLKTRPIVKALENVADMINLYNEKVYYNINEFMHLASLSHDFVSTVKKDRLKHQHSV